MSYEQDMHSEALERFDRAWEFDRENREAARNDLEHLSGAQWEDREVQARAAQDRPSLTINRLAPQVRQVTGDVRQNRPAIKVRPADEGGSSEVADIMSGLIRAIEAKARTKKPYITAAIQAASCGIGHFRILTDYVHPRSFDQEIKLEPIHNPFAVVWDPLSRDATRADAGYCFVTERISREEFAETYPDAAIVDFEEGQEQSEQTEWFDDNAVRIAEYWVKKPVTLTLARMGDGEIVELDELDEGDRASAEANAVDVREMHTHKVCMYKMSGSEVLEGPYDWPTADIPIVAVTGEEASWDDVVKRVSVVRHAKDAQRMYNYWNSSMVEVLALQPKQPFIGTHRQFAANLKDWANVGRSNTPFIAYTPDPSAPPPQRNAPAMASPGMLQAMSVSVDDIKATTGIYDAALGNSSNETSGRAILARQQESDVSTFFIADNLDAAVQQAGKIIVELIPHIYDTPRTLLIRQEDDSEEMVKINQVNPEEGEDAINDLRAGLYDVDVSTGPSFATKRMEAAQSLLEFAQIAPEARPVMMDLIAKNMDWPGADEIASRLRKVLPPGIAESDEGEMTPEAQMRQQMAAQQAQLQQQMAALEMQETAAKIEKTQSEAAQNRVETASDALELAVQSGQLQQVVSAMVQQQLAALVAQNTTAPAPGLGV